METRAESAVDRTPPPAPVPRRRRWGRRVSLWLLLLLMLAAGVHWLCSREEARRLDAQLAGYRAAGEPVTVEELNRWPATTSGSGENAAPLFRAAAATVDKETDAYRAFDQAERLLPLTDAEVAAYEAALKENDKALQTIDEATAKPRIDWGLAYQSPMLADLGKLKDLNGLRNLTNLLHADGLLARQRGDEARALKRVGQILFISRAAGHQPTLVSYLVSLGMSAQAASMASEISPDLAATDAAARDQAKSLIAQLLDDQPVNEARRRALVGERVFQLDTVHALTHGKLGQDDLGPGKNGSGLPAVGYFMRPVFLSNGRAMAAHMTAMLGVTAASPDWPAYKSKAPKSPKTGSLSPRTMLLQILLPSLDRAVSVHYQCLGDRRLAAVCLAARLYAADHGGRLPASLHDLVPDYLPTVPLDPFAGGVATLRYVNEATDPEHPRVYGVAENGIDNGGVEPDPTLPRARFNQLNDEIRHLKRQPRPKPVEREVLYPGLRAFPGGPRPGLPGAPPDEDAEDEAAPAKDADEPAGDTPAENALPGGVAPAPGVRR